MAQPYQAAGYTLTANPQPNPVTLTLTGQAAGKLVVHNARQLLADTRGELDQLSALTVELVCRGYGVAQAEALAASMLANGEG
jgi:hypothetical protein